MHLRSALYGPPDLAEHAKQLLEKIVKALPSDLTVRWALLESGHAAGEGWVEQALDLASHEPARLVAHVRAAMTTTSPPARESLMTVARGITGRHPDFAEGWELLADLLRDEPIPELKARAEIVRLEPDVDRGERAMDRIREIAKEHGDDLAVRMEAARACFHLMDFGPARAAAASLAALDPVAVLELLGEARASDLPLPDDFRLIEATCHHALGNDAAAARQLREARGVSATDRESVIHRLRRSSPASPDLALVRAEVQLETGNADGAAETLRNLLASAPGSAESICSWLSGPAAAELADTPHAEGLRARADLAAGREGDAVARIANLVKQENEWARPLVSAAARVRIAGHPDPELNGEVLRLLRITGLHADHALTLAERLYEDEYSALAIESIGGQIPSDEATEPAWLKVGALLHVSLSRHPDAVRVARSASTPELALRTLTAIEDHVPVKERYLVLEGMVEVLLVSSGDENRVTALLVQLLDEYPDRTTAVATLLGRMPDDDATRGMRLAISGRCEHHLGHRNHAADLFLSSARIAKEDGRAEVVSGCGRRLAAMVEEDPEHDHARVCLSKVESLLGGAEETLAPIRGVSAPNPRLLERLDEVEREFPGHLEVPWTAISWLMEMGSHREAVARLAALLPREGIDRKRIRDEAELAYEAGHLPEALTLIADVDLAERDFEREIETCGRIVADHPDAYEAVRERLLNLIRIHPEKAAPITAALHFAHQAEDLDGVISTAVAAEKAPLDADSIVAVAGSVLQAGDFEAAEGSAAYWTTMAEHCIRARDGEGAVKASQKLILASGDPERVTEKRLTGLFEDGLLPIEGIDLLVARHREFELPDHLAGSIRWRLDAEEPDKKVIGGLRETGESLIEAGSDSADLRLVLTDLSLMQSDAVGALGHVIDGLPLLGVECALAQLARIGEEYPEEARVPLRRAIDVFAPERRVREAALDLERAEELDEDLTVKEGLECARELLAVEEDDPDLLRILARLTIRNGDEDEALEHQNRLAAAGETFREQAIEIFPWLLKRFGNHTEARIRYAEILADSAQSPEMETRRAERWAQCEKECREVLSRSPDPEDEIRTVKLLATSLEERHLHEDAYTALTRSSEVHPEEAEIVRRIRQNHVLRMEHVASEADEGRVKAAALLSAGDPTAALAALEEADPADLEVMAVRLMVHYAADHPEQAVAEGVAIAETIDRDGDLAAEEMEVLYFTGRALLRVGDEATGLSHLERLARADPAHRGCRAFLEDYYRRRMPGTLRISELTAPLEEVKGHG